MKKADVLAALAALAQENRLDTYRLLVQAGPEGMPAGEVATALRLPPNTLSFILIVSGMRSWSPCAEMAGR